MTKLRTQTTLAYCFASGQIGFGPRCPAGALPVVRGPEKAVLEFIEGVARHAYDGKTLLIPGIPEAQDQSEGLAKLNAARLSIDAAIAAARGGEWPNDKDYEEA